MKDSLIRNKDRINDNLHTEIVEGRFRVQDLIVKARSSSHARSRPSKASISSYVCGWWHRDQREGICDRTMSLTYITWRYSADACLRTSNLSNFRNLYASNLYFEKLSLQYSLTRQKLSLIYSFSFFIGNCYKYPLVTLRNGLVFFVGLPNENPMGYPSILLLVYFLG
jgi:hypothetical protein